MLSPVTHTSRSHFKIKNFRPDDRDVVESLNRQTALHSVQPWVRGQQRATDTEMGLPGRRVCNLAHHYPSHFTPCCLLPYSLPEDCLSMSASNSYKAGPLYLGWSGPMQPPWTLVTLQKTPSSEHPGISPSVYLDQGNRGVSATQLLEQNQHLPVKVPAEVGDL